MASEERPQGVHPLDWRAHLLQQRLQRRIEVAQKALKSTTPVGSRKLSKAEITKRMLQLSPDQLSMLMTGQGAGQPVMSSALEQLGAHGMVLLPYLLPQGGQQPLLPPSQEEVF